MIKFLTPTGEKIASSTEHAIELCEKEAGEEAEKTTKIYNRFNSSYRTTIICNNKKWIIPNESRKD